MKKLLSTLAALALIQACSHPLEIIGEGDIVDLNESGRGCTLEQYNAQDKACTKNIVIGAYDVNYNAAPKEGWDFVRWDGPCGNSSEYPDCAHVATAKQVEKFWFTTVPATVAVFCPSDSILYQQDFEGMTPDQGFPPNDLDDDNWIIFGNEYAVNPYTNPTADPTGGYGPFPAANGTPGSIQGVASEDGGPAQGVRHLNKYSDYNNSGQATKFIEGLTLQEFTVGEGDVGYWTLSFDAKRKSPEFFGITGQSSAYAFIKTIDSDQFFEKGFASIDMTSAGEVETWARYAVSLEITEDMIGDLLQFGFSATSFNYESSGIYYDNVIFGTCDDLLIPVRRR